MEGDLDQIVARNAIKRWGLKNWSVYTPNDVDVPADLLEGSTDSGNRGRVLAVASECERELGAGHSNLVAMVDRDRDVFRATGRDYGPYVIVTDFCCLESYIFTPDSVNSTVDVFLGIDGIEDIQVLTAELEKIAHEVYLARSAQHILGLGCRLDSAKADVAASRAGIVFDRDGFVRRLLMAGGAINHLSELEDEIERLRRASAGMAPHPVNGHDLIDLLGHCLRPYTPGSSTALLSPKPLARALASNTDWTTTLTLPAFGMLFGRLSQLG